jgi:hypothetical protein
VGLAFFAQQVWRTEGDHIVIEDKEPGAPFIVLSPGPEPVTEDPVDEPKKRGRPRKNAPDS